MAGRLAMDWLKTLGKDEQSTFIDFATKTRSATVLDQKEAKKEFLNRPRTEYSPP
jgi:hypothetical protein